MRTFISARRILVCVLSDFTVISYDVILNNRITAIYRCVYMLISDTHSCAIIEGRKNMSESFIKV